jgi:hypothetical protein
LLGQCDLQCHKPFLRSIRSLVHIDLFRASGLVLTRSDLAAET